MRLKLIAGIAAALVLVLMAAAYAIVSSYDFNKFKPLITGAVRDATGRELTIGGDIGLKFGLSPALVAGDVGFENAPWGSRPEMARIKRLEAEVSLIPLIFGNVVVKRLVLAGPDILVERDRFGRSNLEFGTKKKARPPAPSAEEANIPSFKKIRIENGLLAYRDGQSGRLYEVKISSFDARTEAMGGRIEAGLKGAYNGMSFDASWRISNPSPGAYDISDLRASFGESDLSGTLGVIFGGKQPGLRAELSSKKLDLRPLLGKTDKKGGEEAGVKKEKVFSGSPLPFDALKKAEADLRLSAGKILLPRMALNGLEARMTVKDGRLTFKPLKASIGGGAFEGRLHLDTRGKTPELSAVFRAEGIDMGKMLKELGVEEAFEGKINVDIDVKGSGGTTAALMAGLNGNLSVVMGKGRMDNKYLGLLGADLGTGLERLINPSAGKTGGTEINCFVCRLDAKAGVVDTTALVLDTSLMSVVGGGRVDLKTERLNLSLRPSPKKSLGAGGYGLSLSELAKPFRLGGTLARPSLALDPAETAITVGKAVGGMALFGPAGIVSALAGEKEGDKNPCLAALEAAKKGKRPEEKGAVRGTAKDIGEGIKKLFGR